MKKYFTRLIAAVIASGMFSPLAFAINSKVDILFMEPCEQKDIYECPVLEPSESPTVLFPRNLQQGDTFSIAIFVRNKTEEKIVSVSSWLKYDTSLLKAVELSDKDSDFPLAAPDGNKIEESTGQVQIGRGAGGGGLSGDLLLIATVKFEVISPQKRSTEISFVNFQKVALGETGVFVLNEGTFQPENIMEEAPKALGINLNGGNAGGQETSSPDNSPEETGNTDSTDPEDTSVDETRLPRPEGLRIQAKSGSTDLIWQLSNDHKVKGYFVYYSENSGFYIRRRDVGRTNHHEFTDLKKNQKYYFAITAYDEQGKESDYSDEVSATHGVPGSESHPFRREETPTGGKVSPPSKTDLNDSGPAETVSIVLGILGIFCFAYSSLRLRLFS